MLGPPPTSTLFPYTTLFRSWRLRCAAILFATQKRSPSSRLFARGQRRSEEHTSELQSHSDLVCRLLLEKKKPATFPRSTRTCAACAGAGASRESVSYRITRA